MPTLNRADKKGRISQNEARRRKECTLAELRELEVAERKLSRIPADQVRDAWVKAPGHGSPHPR